MKITTLETTGSIVGRCRLVLFFATFLLVWRVPSEAATWTKLANLAPTFPGTMLQLTDGTVMVQGTDKQSWMRLTPDAQGSYINGTWTANPISQMTTPRLYFASHVLPNGKVWIQGGEYSGVGVVENWSGTGEIYDPVSNSWSAIAPYPGQSDCPFVGQFGGVLANGSPILAQIASTAGWQVGWTLTGSGIPANTTILSVDSASQIHLSQNATTSSSLHFTLGAKATGNTTVGSAIISGISSTAGFQFGWTVSGAGITSGATITSVDSATQIHISLAATATGAGTALTFAVRTQYSSCFGDVPSMLLPGGKILAGNLQNTNTYLYDIAANTWTLAAKKGDRSAEEGWAMLGDGTVVGYQIRTSATAGSGFAERYNPATNTWSSISPGDGTAKGTFPLLTSSASGNELGPILRLHDDRIFAIGANQHTALYTPSTNTWAAGPDMVGTLGGSPVPFGADDAPAAVLPNGHVLLAADAALGVSLPGTTTAGSPIISGISSTATLLTGWAVSGTGIPSGATIVSIDSASQVTLSQNATATNIGVTVKFGGTFSKPTQIFDFDPSTNTINPVSPARPDTTLNTVPSYVTRMLMLPTGEVLFTDSSRQLWIYTPDGPVNDALRPTVTGVFSNGGNQFTLSGTQLSGQSAGSAYGDDAESDENYPIVRLVSASGQVYYARTTNWSYVGVGGGSLPQTVNFTVDPAMPLGTYSLIVSAAGISSLPATFSSASTCSFLVGAGGQAFAASGGSGTVTVATSAGCSWSALGAPAWISFVGASSGSGNGSVTFQAAANVGAARSGSFVIGGSTFTVEQQAASISGLSAVGSLGQVTSEGTWDFSLAAINLGTTVGTARFTFADNNGNPLMMPLTFPQSPGAAGSLLAAALDRQVNPNAQIVIESTGPDSAPQLIGWGQLAAAGSVSGFGIFSNPTYGWNAVVPLETRNAGKYVLAFDNTTAAATLTAGAAAAANPLATGVAVANLAATAANIPAIIRDDTGAQIGTPTISLPAKGHTSFLLNQQYAATVNKRGTIEFDTPAGGQISVLGLRANGGALTTLPVLASSDAPGGAIAQLTYNGGFTSVVYLVNTGAASASFTLSFFDESGGPLSVPLSLPQSGTTMTTSALTQTLAAGAMLVVETIADDAAVSVVGSAQLTTTGNISGFEIFRWTTFGQEASVPLETRTPGSFVLVYDDANGLTTGVALANVASTAANITVKIYSDAGALLQTSAINLVGRGHTSFLLPDPARYPITANRRGMVEFVVPPGAKINAVGLRAKADGTLTTIPVLTK